MIPGSNGDPESFKKTIQKHQRNTVWVILSVVTCSYNLNKL